MMNILGNLGELFKVDMSSNVYSPELDINDLTIFFFLNIFIFLLEMIEEMLEELSVSRLES